MISLESRSRERSAQQTYFPLASQYSPRPDSISGVLREPSTMGRAFSYSERHLQAVWYDPRWRPALLFGHRGEEIHVEFAGTWNLESGPDFLGATLMVGPEKRRITGDVEIHIFPADWKNHGHHNDPRYRNVCLHLTYFEGQLPETVLPPGALQAALRPALKSEPQFAFEHVDITAYPYAGRADVPPCRMELAKWSIDSRAHLLEAAGHERLRRKTERFSSAISEKGIDQVFYEALMTALGYQHNKHPFHKLAVLLPAETLRSLSRHDPDHAYALLAGMSGLLPEDMKKNWDAETRSQIRGWWDVWWRHRSQVPKPMARSEWRLNGIRPFNHPLRRMMAAAWLATNETDGLRLLDRWFHGVPKALNERILQSLALPENAYWHNRQSLGGIKQTSPAVLLGSDRIPSLAMNVIIPMAAACGFDATQLNNIMSAIRPEAFNQIMKQAEFYLFGPDAPSSLLQSANRRQGLMQIFNDYCLNDRSQCRICSFPELLARSAAHAGQTSLPS